MRFGLNVQVVSENSSYGYHSGSEVTEKAVELYYLSIIPRIRYILSNYFHTQLTECYLEPIKYVNKLLQLGSGFTVITEVMYDGQTSLHSGEHGAFVRWRPLGRRETVDESVPEGFSHGYRALFWQMISTCYRNRQETDGPHIHCKGKQIRVFPVYQTTYYLSLSTRIHDNVRNTVKHELEARTHVPMIYIDVTES